MGELVRVRVKADGPDGYHPDIRRGLRPGLELEVPKRFADLEYFERVTAPGSSSRRRSSTRAEGDE